MIDGWVRRYQHEEDLYIKYSALPVFQMKLGHKAPSFERMTRHRRVLADKHSNSLANLSHEELLAYLKSPKGVKK